MTLDVLCQILRLAKRRGLARDKLLIDVRPFKNEENDDEVNPFSEDEVECLQATCVPNLQRERLIARCSRSASTGLRTSSAYKAASVL